MIADTVARSIGWHRPYWAPMTVAIVLKPDFTTTFSRGVLRLAGTFTGLALATALFHWLSPSAMVQAVFIGIFMFLMRWAGPANYGVLVTALTALVVLLFAITGVAPAELIAARALYTVIGGTIALAAYRIWPTWERTQVPEALARLLDAYRAYFQAVRDAYLRPGLESDPVFAARLERVRQAGRLARTTLEASVARLRLEPGVTASRLTRLQAILANSHRFIHAVMALEAGLFRSRPAPARAGIRHIRQQCGFHLVLPGRLFAWRAGKARRPARPPRGSSRAGACGGARCGALRAGQCGVRPRHQQPEYAGGRAHPMGRREA